MVTGDGCHKEDNVAVVFIIVFLLFNVQILQKRQID